MLFSRLRLDSRRLLLLELLAISVGVTAPPPARADDPSPKAIASSSKSTQEAKAHPVPGKQLPSNYLPVKFKLSIGGFSGPSHWVELQGETLNYCVRRYDDESQKFREVVKQIKPSPRQWDQFWRTMKEADLWRWRPEYPNPPQIADGTQWSVEVEYGGKRIKSSGSNNYPGHKQGQPYEGGMSPLYDKYLAAVGDLLGAPLFQDSSTDGIPVSP